MNISSSEKANIKVNSYNNIGSNKINFSNQTYDFPELDYSIYAAPSVPNFTFSNEIMEENTSVLTSVTEVLLKTGASIANFEVSILEGFVSFVEAVGDLAILTLGAATSAATVSADIVQALVTGDWSFKNTKSLWSNMVMPAVGYDVTSKTFNWARENIAPLKQIDEMAYDPFKSTGAMYKIGKTTGYYTGAAIATALTGGAFSAVSVPIGTTGFAITGSTIVNATITGVSAIGRSAQKNYISSAEKYLIEQGYEENQAKKLSNDQDFLLGNVRLSGGEIAKDITGAVGSGLVEFSFAAGAGILKSCASGTANAFSYYAKTGTTSSGSIIDKTLSNASVFLENHKVFTNISASVLKSSKAFANEGISSYVSGEDYNLKNAAIDFGSSVAVDLAFIGAESGIKNLGEKLDFGGTKFNANKINSNLPETLLQINSNIKKGPDGLNIEKAVADAGKEAYKRMSKETVKDVIKKADKK